jgi:hypothetical protein
MRYSGGHPKFRERCEAVVADGYRELTLTQGTADQLALRALPDAGVGCFGSRHGIDRFSQLIFPVFSV